MLRHLGGIGRALAHRNCAIYLTGMFVSLNGTFVYLVAMGWLAWELTKSSGWVGAIVFIETLPNVLLVPFAGALVDRGNALVIQRFAQVAQGLAMAGLATATVFDRVDIYVLAGFALALGTCNAFSVPAHFSVVARLAPRQDLSAVLALQSSCAQSARFIGPALAGVFLATVGPGWAFAFNGATYFIYAFALLFLRIPYEPTPAAGRRGLLDDMVEGFSFIRNSRTAGALVMVAFTQALLLRPVVDLMPAFVGDVLHEGPIALSWLLSTVGISALCGSLWLARRGETRGLSRMMLTWFAVSTVAVTSFALERELVLAVAVIALYGIASSIANVANMTLMQIQVDDRIRARVMGLYSLNHRAVPAVGALLVGNAALLIPLNHVMLIAAGLSMALWLWLARRMQSIDLESQPAET